MRVSRIRDINEVYEELRELRELPERMRIPVRPPRMPPYVRPTPEQVREAMEKLAEQFDCVHKIPVKIEHDSTPNTQSSPSSETSEAQTQQKLGNWKTLDDLPEYARVFYERYLRMIPKEKLIEYLLELPKERLKAIIKECLWIGRKYEFRERMRRGGPVLLPIRTRLWDKIMDYIVEGRSKEWYRKVLKRIKKDDLINLIYTFAKDQIVRFVDKFWIELYDKPPAGPPPSDWPYPRMPIIRPSPPSVIISLIEQELGNQKDKNSKVIKIDYNSPQNAQLPEESVNKNRTRDLLEEPKEPKEIPTEKVLNDIDRDIERRFAEFERNLRETLGDLYEETRYFRPLRSSLDTVTNREPHDLLERVRKTDELLDKMLCPIFSLEQKPKKSRRPSLRSKRKESKPKKGKRKKASNSNMDIILPI